MNSSGFKRGMMSKQYNAEYYLIHVGKSIEQQIKEWDERYCVNIMKFTDYVFVVKLDSTYHETILTELEVEYLKNWSPYSLDKRIWQALQEEGLDIKKWKGNYLDKVFR